MRSIVVFCALLCGLGAVGPAAAQSYNSYQQERLSIEEERLEMERERHDAWRRQQYGR